MGKVLAEIENRFSGNDQDVRCALCDVTLRDSSASDSFDQVAGCNVDKELLQADQRLFNQFKKRHVEKSIKTTAVIDVLHVNSLYEITLEFKKVESILAVIPATSYSEERSFSGLRRSKTYLRNTMGQHRLSSLAIICIERAYGNQVMVNSMDKMINIFGQRHRRKNYLANIETVAIIKYAKFQLRYFSNESSFIR